MTKVRKSVHDGDPEFVFGPVHAYPLRSRIPPIAPKIQVAIVSKRTEEWTEEHGSDAIFLVMTGRGVNGWAKATLAARLVKTITDTYRHNRAGWISYAAGNPALCPLGSEFSQRVVGV